MITEEMSALVKSNCKHSYRDGIFCKNCRKVMRPIHQIILFEEESIWMDKKLTINFNSGPNKGLTVKTKVDQLIWWNYALNFYPYSFLVDYEKFWNSCLVGWRDYPILELLPLQPFKKPEFNVDGFIESFIRNGGSFAEAAIAVKKECLIERILVPYQTVANLKVS